MLWQQREIGAWQQLDAQVRPQSETLAQYQCKIPAQLQRLLEELDLVAEPCCKPDCVFILRDKELWFDEEPFPRFSLTEVSQPESASSKVLRRLSSSV